MAGKQMDNFKTVAAVLVVLLAFTGFQLIANYSLRKAVRADVAGQIERIEGSEAELLRLRQGLKETAADLEKLRGVAKEIAALEKAVAGLERLKELPKEIEKLSAAIDALKAKIDAAAAKTGALEGPVDALGKKIGSLDGKIPAAKDLDRLAGVTKEIDALAAAAATVRVRLDSAAKAADRAALDKPVARIQKALAELDVKITDMKNKLTEGSGT
jgi:chromosome segregation ATPase